MGAWHDLSDMYGNFRESGRLIKHLKQALSCCTPWKDALINTRHMGEDIGKHGTLVVQAANRARGRNDDYAMRPPIRLHRPPLRLKGKTRRNAAEGFLGAQAPETDST